MKTFQELEVGELQRCKRCDTKREKSYWFLCRKDDDDVCDWCKDNTTYCEFCGVWKKHSEFDEGSVICFSCKKHLIQLGKKQKCKMK